MWDLKIINTDKSLYVALSEAIERDIKEGKLKSGDKMPTHRELAKIVGVNVTTVTRAYEEAKKRGIITSVVGSGTFVASDLGQNSSLINTDNDTACNIEMGLVLPLYSNEPVLNSIVNEISKKNINELIRYSPPQGLLHHRQTGAAWVKRYGINACADDVIITAGAQHALICILSSVFEPGDRIAVDSVVYPGYKSAAKRCGIQLEAVPMDKQGMTATGLESLCNRHEIKGIYTVACMQNPTNCEMTKKRVNEIVSIIKKYKLTLIEDDLYRFLSIENIGTLSEHLPENSIYIAGISKAFYAGLRISFVLTSRKYYNRISQAVVDTMWMASPICAEIACKCIDSGLADKIIEQKKVELSKRAEIFNEKFSEYDYRYVDYSMFVWLKLPHSWDSIRLERACHENGVNVVASDKFIVGNVPLPNYVRISLSGAENLTEFEKGLDIILATLKHETGTVEYVF